MNQRDIKRRLLLPLLLTALLVPCAQTTDAARVAATNDSRVVASRAPTDARVAVFPSLAAQSNAVGINGFFGSNRNDKNSYAGKLIYAIGTRPGHGPTHDRFLVMTFENAGGECVRLRYFAQQNEIANSIFRTCGLYDFRFGEGAPEERLAVYEGRAIVRFNVVVPADYEQGVAHVRASVRFQSCNDEVCFPPATRELDLAIAIVGRDTPVNHINGQYFGSGRRRRG